MGRNAAFGRPKVHDRLRLWWGGRDKAFRQNALLALGVGAVAVALVVAATSRDTTRPSPVSNAARPQIPPLQPLSTVDVGNLSAAGGPVTSTTSSTTTSTTAVATTVPTPPPPTTTATVAPPTPATTVPNPDVILTEVPPASSTTTPPVTAAPVVTTPPVTAAPTTIPSANTTTTAAPVLPLPLAIPPLLGPG